MDLAVSKSVNEGAPAVGVPFEYTVIFSNNTAAPGVAPLDAHDVIALVTDTAPAGVVFDSWDCAASTGASCTASGTGDINDTVTLPAGGNVTYTVLARATGTPHCGSITNTATVATPAGFQEGSAVAPGFMSPLPLGVANNSASEDIDPICPASVLLQKVTTGAAGGPFGFTLGNTTQANGTVTTLAAGAAVQVDGDAAPGMQPFSAAALGTAITIDESSIPTGWLLRDAVCTRAGTPVGSLVASVYTIPAGEVIEAAQFTCMFTNSRRAAELAISKGNGVTSVLSGGNTTYTVVVSNQGPDAADGAVVVDTPGAGLSGCSATCPAANLTGGASCPAVPADIVGAGAVIPVLPAGSSVTFQVVCGVQ